MQQADQETQISSPHSETLSFNCVILIETSSPNPPAPPPPKSANPVSRPALLAFVASPEPYFPELVVILVTWSNLISQVALGTRTSCLQRDWKQRA